MSDDEVPEMPMDGEMGDNMSDDMGEDVAAPSGGLPEGIKKEVITEAPSGNWKKPKVGDEVTVHYVGTLESDGSEFDSSRSRAKPFVFTLGKGQVIKGWDLGVATMKKGELAKFTLAPEFAYGDAGSPPKIPEKATLVFEVELISWLSKEDLFGDEGVIKTQLEEGSGWKSPKDGDEVLMSFKTQAADGSILEERSGFEYTIGSGGLGSIAKACDKALIGMKRGEAASLKCSKDYADADGSTVTLSLKEVFETKDVSLAKNQSMMKKQVKEGEGYDMPKEGAPVELSVEAATDGTQALPGFTAKVLKFTAGNGEVCDALECAAAAMKKGERAILTVTLVALAAEAQLGLKDVVADKVALTIELLEFEKGKDTWSMSEEEKLEFGMRRKQVGTELFKSGRVAMALRNYKKVCELFGYMDGIKDETIKSKATELKQVSDLNQAACHLKLKDFREAQKSCNAVLKDDRSNVKALYRHAQADLGLNNVQECIRDCKRIVELDPQNRDVRSLLKKARVSQKEEDEKSKGLFANMCKALGKGPIREPYKEKNSNDFHGDDGSDGEAPMDLEAPAKDSEAPLKDVAMPGEAEEDAGTATAGA